MLHVILLIASCYASAGLTQQVERISLTSATVSWEAPSSAFYFIVSWERMGGPLCDGLLHTKGDSNKITERRYTMEGLLPKTEWNVSVSSYSESGNKTFTSVMHFSTKGVFIDGVTDTRATVKLWPTSCAENAGIRLYALKVGRRLHPTVCTIGQLCLVDLGGLAPLTEYSVSITSAEDEDILTAIIATTGDASPLRVTTTDNNQLTCLDPYSAEDVPTDGLAYMVSCSCSDGETENGTVSLNGGSLPLEQRGVLYNCSLLLARGTVTAQRSNEFKTWAVSKAVDSAFGLPLNGIWYTKGDSVVTVAVPQFIQEGVPVRLYDITVSSDYAEEGACSSVTYTAVQLLKNEVFPNTTVTVGDGSTVNGVYNRPLTHGCKLSIGVAVVDMRGAAVFTDVYPGVLIDSATVTPNTIACVVCGLILISLLNGVFFWRNCRPSSPGEVQKEMDAPRLGLPGDYQLFQISQDVLREHKGDRVYVSVTNHEFLNREEEGQNCDKLEESSESCQVDFDEHLYEDIDDHIYCTISDLS